MEDNLPKGEAKQVLFTAKQTQGEVKIGAASFLCGLIDYHVKINSFLS
jgi:hypothetical protein